MRIGLLLLLLLAACVQDPPAPATSAPDADHDGTPDASDCAPADPLIPGPIDANCDGVDDDCDGSIDDDAPTTAWYSDRDHDGAGDPDDVLEACAQPDGYVAEGTDCDPGDPNVAPGAEEFCDDVDDDCDGALDDVTVTTGLPTWYRDADSDGWGVTDDAVTTCFLPDGYVSLDGDCDDADPARNPGEPEVCDDGDVDENCNGAADDDDWATGGATAWVDRDGDGAGSEVVWRCDPDTSVVEIGGDCDDDDATISPLASDACGDGVDADCDGEDPPC